MQTWSTDTAAVERYWRAADEHGFARITYGDGPWDFAHDGWTMLGALAAVTRHARVGPAVTYAFDPIAHHPVWLARRAVAVDHLSAGRLDLRLAVGAGGAAASSAWERQGIRYPTVGERLAALDEALGIVRALWRGETVDADGSRFRARGLRLAPLPVQRGGPPVWIAAVRPRALALAARCADGWEASYVSPVEFEALSARLDALLAALGRHPADVRRSVEIDVVLADSARERETWVRRFCAERQVHPGHALLDTALIGDADEVAARVERYAGAGATDLMLGFADFPAMGMLERFARDVRPRLGRGASARALRTARDSP